MKEELQYYRIIDVSVKIWILRDFFDPMDPLTIRNKDGVLNVLNKMAEDIEVVFNKLKNS